MIFHSICRQVSFITNGQEFWIFSFKGFVIWRIFEVHVFVIEKVQMPYFFFIQTYFYCTCYSMVPHRCLVFLISVSRFRLHPFITTYWAPVHIWSLSSPANTHSFSLTWSIFCLLLTLVILRLILVFIISFSIGPSCTKSSLNHLFYWPWLIFLSFLLRWCITGARLPSKEFLFYSLLRKPLYH